MMHADGRVCFAAGALLGAAILLGGCAGMQRKLGMRVDLAKLPVASMQVSSANPQGIAPGGELALIVQVTQPDGKVLRTQGAGGGTVAWEDLSVKATVAVVDAKGVLRLAPDPRQSEGQTAHVVVTAPSHPDLRAELDVPVRYNTKFTLNFSGQPGRSGLDGRSGINGSPGMPGSLDPNHPSAGGNGGDGTDGTNGDDGGRGGDAASVEIRVRVQGAVQPLLQASVTVNGNANYFLIDPKGGSLWVAANGGMGGQGGRGGCGGRGGSGGTGTPNGSQGRNGLDGHDGLRGWDGRGGTIRVIYDPAAKPYLNAIHLSNRNGPEPGFDEEAMGELW
jgi:hypothetical protein